MEERLIELVRKERFLYDKRNRNYKNIYLRDQKFDEFSKDLNVPAAKLKLRWRSLRDSFLKELRKKEALSGTGESTHKKNWKYFDQMKFLSIIPNENKNSTGDFENDFIEEDKNIFGEDTMFDVDLFRKPSNNEFSLDESSSSSLNNKRKTYDDILASANANLELVNTAKMIFDKPPVPKTAAGLFFESMAHQVDNSNLTPHEFVCLQIEMLQLLTKYICKN